MFIFIVIKTYSMSNFKNMKDEILAFKDYRSKLSQAAKDESKKSYLITKKELDNILNQLSSVGDDNKAIRIYFGAKNINNETVPTMHVLACEVITIDSSGLPVNTRDYKVPETLQALDAAEAGNILPKIAIVHPCPPKCPTTNVFS